MPRRRTSTRTRLLPVLPTEILLCILEQLNRYDLRCVILANSAMAAIARPLCYRFGTSSKSVIVFPLAPASHPMLQTTDPRISLSNEQQGHILPKLKTLTLCLHKTAECIGHDVSVFKGKIKTLKVLRLHYSYDLPGKLPQSSELTYCTEGASRIQYCFAAPELSNRCRYLTHVLSGQTTVAKLVIRNATLGGRIPDFSPSTFFSRFKPLRECVHVLSGSSTRGDTDADPTHLTDVCTVGYAAHTVTLPKATEHLTIVFWPGASRRWRPPCYRIGCGNLWSLQAKDVCPRYAKMWEQLAELVCGSHLKRLTVVYAETVPPIHTTYKQHHRDMKDGLATHDSIREHFYSTYRELCTRLKKTPLRISHMPFLTLVEWLDTAEWQDVFSPGEISDHFEARASGQPMPESWARYVRFAEELGFDTELTTPGRAASQ